MKKYKLSKRIITLAFTAIIVFVCALPAFAVKTTYYSFNPPEGWQEKKDVQVISEGIEDLSVFILPGDKKENFRLYVHDNSAIKAASELNDESIKKFENELKESIQNLADPDVKIQIDKINTKLIKIKSSPVFKTIIEQTVSIGTENFKFRVVDYSFFLKNKVVHAQFTVSYDSLMTSKDMDDVVKKIKISGEKLPAKDLGAKKESKFNMGILLIIGVVVLFLIGITVLVVVLVKNKKEG